MLQALPSIVEQFFLDYLQPLLAEGTPHTVFRCYSAEQFRLPAIIIRADAFQLNEEDVRHVYRGTVTFGVETQIDDTEDLLTVHDNVTANIYDALADEAAIFTASTVEGSLIAIRYANITGIAQGYDPEARAARSAIELEIIVRR